MRSFIITPNGDGSSTVTQQRGPLRRAGRIWLSVFIYGIGWSLLWAQPVFVGIMVVTCLIIEKVGRLWIREKAHERAVAISEANQP